jgi:TPP-dependent pyruvate/acetoin dehydrogenase alpha subunit
MSKSDLGTLTDPLAYHQNLSLNGSAPQDLLRYLQQMIVIRHAERKLASMRRDGLIGGPVHLGVGQEAIAVGVSSALRKTDRVFGAHRSHSHLLALGSSVRGLFAEVLGRDTGHSRGMGGSMHLWDQPNGFYGSVPIVAGTVPLAVGAGLAAKLQGGGDVAVAYLGDGAVEEGVVHESLNLSSILGVPVLFVVENNLFASHMHISLRQPSDSTARFALANNIPHAVVDGNDVVDVAAAASRFVSASRAGKGPGFLEVVTYRWYGHVDWREDIDVGVNRSTVDIENWRARDPIARLVGAMKSNGYINDQQLEDIESTVAAEIDAAWEVAMADPYPGAECLLDRVYSQ